LITLQTIIICFPTGLNTFFSVSCKRTYDILPLQRRNTNCLCIAPFQGYCQFFTKIHN